MTTDKIKRAEAALVQSQVREHLKAFEATVVSTIFVGLDLEASDIDIICCIPDFTHFEDIIRQHFSDHDRFALTNRNGVLLVNFWLDGFEFEIYGSSTSILKQPAFRHYQIMQRLVELGGMDFQAAIRQLKSEGLKTEPAIAALLGLAGDPYQAVLELVVWSDVDILTRLNQR